MYQHLLVPVDATPLSAANVQAAVRLAQNFGARISFFHATPDFAASSDGALLYSRDPGAFMEEMVGDTNVLLLKAAAAAKFGGVSCQTLSCVSDRPGEAIVEAAIERSADLIVMASRGTRDWTGWLHSSRTERVLRRAPVALLVTRVEAQEPLNACERALGCIQDEHRSVAVVMQSLRSLVDGAEEPTPEIVRQIGMLVAYLRDFPQRLHHPKEEAYLHRDLRLRYPACANLLETLEQQHVREAALVDAVLAELRPKADGSPCDGAGLRSAVRALVVAVGEHMALEESSVFSLARAHLHESDWEAIATAFEANDDVRFGQLPSAEFHRIFKRIADLSA